MRRRLPPLNALRAFEAASRHLSFTRAAEELFVTPGAVSRQVKLLEDYFGVQLFDRSGAALVMPDRSRDYGAALTDTLARIDEATQAFLSTQRDQRLHFCCAMTFTIRWIMTRLPGFHALHPARALRITTDVPVPAVLSSVDIDVAVRLEKLDVDLAESHRLVDNDLIPVCSPQYLADHPVRGINDLANMTLLHSLLRRSHWGEWIKATGATELDPQSGLDFGSSTLAYQAAIEGLGCAIGQVGLVYDDLVSGRLVVPLKIIYSSDLSFNLVYDKEKGRLPKIVEFRDWIIAEAQRFNEDIARYTDSYDRVHL